MICPNINSKEWKDLVAKIGEDAAYAFFQATGSMTEVPLTQDEFSGSDIESRIEDMVTENERYYRTAYKSFLSETLGNKPSTVNNMVAAFTARALSYGGSLTVDDTIVANDGVHLLFPETREDFKMADVVPNSMLSTLEDLSMRFNVPYVVIHDANMKFKGKYIRDGNEQLVVINTAYADATTALHEYYHPFVRILMNTNKALFDLIEKEARQSTGSKEDSEELVTQYLADKAYNRKPTTLLGKFFAFITNLLKKAYRKPTPLLINEATTLKELLDYLEGDVNVSTERTLGKAYKTARRTLTDVFNQMTQGGGAPPDQFSKDNTGRDYLTELRAAAEEFTTSDDSSYYHDQSGAPVARRLTPFIGDREIGEFSVKSKKYKYSTVEYRVRKIYTMQNKDQKDKPADEITDTVVINGRNLNFKQATKIIELDENANRLKGKIVHGMIQYMLEKDPKLKAQAVDQTRKYLKEYDPNWTATVELHPDFALYADNLESLLTACDIKVNVGGETKYSSEEMDVIIPEVTIKSDLFTDAEGMPIASTIDGLVQHANGEVSSFDWKTGGIFRDVTSNIMMAYGDKYDISDTKLNRAYLEQVLRTMILKEKFPTMRFRSVNVVKVDRNGRHIVMRVDMQPFLMAVGEFYKQNLPAKYKVIKDAGLLDYSTYVGTDKAVIHVREEIAGMAHEEQAQYLNAKIREITDVYPEQIIQDNKYLSDKLNAYTEALLYISKQPFINLDTKGEDLNVAGTIKNFSEVDNPKIQVLHGELIKARKNSRARLQEYSEEHDKLFKAMLKSDGRTTRQVNLLFQGAIAASVIAVNPFFFGLSIGLNFIWRRMRTNRRDFNAFMWRYDKTPGREGWYMNTKATYMDKNGNEVLLTPEQKAYRAFIYKSLKTEYEASMREVVGYGTNQLGETDYNRPITRGTRLGKPETMPKDFMPRIPASVEELREQENWYSNVIGLKTSLKRFSRVHLLNSFENEYTTQTAEAIPMRFVPKESSKIVEGENHSFDVQEIFKTFLGSTIYKQEFDPIYALAMGVKNSLNVESDPEGKRRYPNLTQWLDNEIYSQILNKPKEVKLTRTIRHTVGKLGSVILDLPVGTPIEIPQDKLLRLLKTSITHSVMAFKLISAGRNLATLTVTNAMQATKSIVSRAVGIPPDNFTPGFKSTTLGLKDVAGFWLDAARGKDNSKIMLIAKEFDWLPDNYHYDVNRNDFVNQAVSIGPLSHSFMFHNFGETYAAMWHLATLLNSMQMENAAGEKFTAMEAYDVVDGKLVWTKGVRGQVRVNDTTTKTLEGLDEFEIKNLKRAYEKLQGSYRKEEKTAIESTILGEFVMQFKKFYYTYAKNLLASEYKDMTVGRYIRNRNIERPGGVPIYDWEYQVMQGRLRVGVAALSALANPLNAKTVYNQKLEVADLKADPYSKKRQWAELVNTGIWLTFLFYLFNAFFMDDDDEKDSVSDKFWDRVLEDSSMALNPKDFFSNLEKPIVAADRVAKLGDASITFVWRGLLQQEHTRDGSMKGLNTLLRATPGPSHAMQMSDMFKGGEYDPLKQEQFLNLIPTR